MRGWALGRGAAAVSGVRDTDQGAKAFVARLHELAAGKKVRVGVLDDAPKQEHDGASGRGPSASPSTATKRGSKGENACRAPR